ncbi:MAG: Chemotaxis response regulator protein [Parcubacteria group bacterium GW2011_GWA2_50_10b]|nr:MAG: Chemotaxis response regulator protein [Parcubacteria group bacterium GW2011_GWA2_50_10b]
MAKKYTVLLVDDDKFLLEMYRKKFESSGTTVDVAVGSAEALSKLRGGAKPDILILDIIMPGMDGLELLQAIRKEKLAESATIIMLTNESGRDKIEQAKKLGIKGYIVKATSIPTEVVEEALKIANLQMPGGK